MLSPMAALGLLLLTLAISPAIGTAHHSGWAGQAEATSIGGASMPAPAATSSMGWDPARVVPAHAKLRPAAKRCFDCTVHRYMSWRCYEPSPLPDALRSTPAPKPPLWIPPQTVVPRKEVPVRFLPRVDQASEDPDPTRLERPPRSRCSSSLRYL
jgi:hypothetical protein